MTSITAVVVTKDEATQIEECLETLQWTDERMVFDQISSDQTANLARSVGATVYVHDSPTIATQRSAALMRVQTEWALFVDADERVPLGLAEEIRRVVPLLAFAGWWIPRKNFIFGQFIQHAGMYPDYQLRLFRREAARYDPKQLIHEVAQVNGNCGYLQNPLVHYSYPDWRAIRETQLQYARAKAEILYNQGVRPTHHLMTAPVLTFYRRFIKLQGFRNGWPGLKLCIAMAYYYAFMTYLQLHRLVRERQTTGLQSQ